MKQDSSQSLPGFEAGRRIQEAEDRPTRGDGADIIGNSGREGSL